MESEARKTKLLHSRIAELERIVGQKQIEINFLNELIQTAGAELKVDLKKTFCTKQ
jgi:transposase